MTYWAHTGNSHDKASWQPLIEHLLAVAAKTKGFAESFGAGQIGWIAGLCHDLGKYSDAFQKRLEDQRLRVDHSSAGAALTFQKYGAVGRLIAYAVAGHHGGLPDGGQADEAALTWRVTQKDIPDYSAYSSEVSLPGESPKLSVKPHPCWCGFTAAFFARMLFSCLVDADSLDAEAFCDPAKSRERELPLGLAELEGRLARHLEAVEAGAPDTVVNRKRAEVLSDCLAAAENPTGLFTLTVPTGGGKTLSSLAFALKHARLHALKRVIYVIPFTSIIEQNAGVFRQAVGSDVVLEHHSNVVYPDDKSDVALPSPLELAEENWDIPLVVTTNVQFFESLFSNERSRCRKIHNIAESVVILDEAQMLPTGILRPCVAAICELARNYRTTVVLCSATQPALERVLPADAQPREIVRDPEGLYGSLRRVEARNIGSATDEVVVGRLLERNQVLCIVNTRRHARQVYELLGKREGHYHLSAAMCPAHRSRRLCEIRSRLASGETCRVVSTQLIEAGVDVDFPTVIRAMAGIDSIAQAAGRCNREGKLPQGDVLVFTPAGGEGMSHPWFGRTASIASSFLEGAGDPLGLDTVHRYFADLYFYEEGSQASWGKGPSGLDANGIMEKWEVARAKLEFPFREVSDLFKVIGEDTFGLVIPYENEGRELLAELQSEGISRRLARRLQPYTVSLRVWERTAYQNAGFIDDIGGVAVLADPTLYDEDYGLVPPPAVASGGEKWII